MEKHNHFVEGVLADPDHCVTCCDEERARLSAALTRAEQEGEARGVSKAANEIPDECNCFMREPLNKDPMNHGSLCPKRLRHVVRL